MSLKGLFHYLVVVILYHWQHGPNYVILIDVLNAKNQSEIGLLKGFPILIRTSWMIELPECHPTLHCPCACQILGPSTVSWYSYLWQQQMLLRHYQFIERRLERKLTWGIGSRSTAFDLKSRFRVVDTRGGGSCFQLCKRLNDLGERRLTILRDATKDINAVSGNGMRTGL